MSSLLIPFLLMTTSKSNLHLMYEGVGVAVNASCTPLANVQEENLSEMCLLYFWNISCV